MNRDLLPLSRRELLARSGTGLGMMALAGLLVESEPATAASGYQNPLLPKSPHFAGQGEARHPPVHERRALPRRYVRSQAGAGEVRRQGAAQRQPAHRAQDRRGAAVAVQVPEVRRKRHRGQRALRQDGASSSTTSASSARCTPTCPITSRRLMLMNCGDSRLTRPSMGSWVTYGLGTENQNLPGFIAMCPGGYPIKGPENWQQRVPARRLPGHVHRHASTREIDKLIENIQNQLGHAPTQQRASSICSPQLNRRHAEARQQDPALEARIQSFELAYRMQMEATDAFDVSREPKHVLRHVRPRRAGPADADRPPAGRARRALRAALARRRAAVGQPRRPRGPTIASWPASATRPSPRCCAT